MVVGSPVHPPILPNLPQDSPNLMKFPLRFPSASPLGPTLLNNMVLGGPRKLEHGHKCSHKPLIRPLRIVAQDIFGFYKYRYGLAITTLDLYIYIYISPLREPFKGNL